MAFPFLSLSDRLSLEYKVNDSDVSSVYLGFMQPVRNGTALQADLTCQPDPTISRARLVGTMPGCERDMSLMGLCLPDLTAIALRAPKRIRNLYYEDCSNALTIVLIFPLAFGVRRAPFGISILWPLIAADVVQQQPHVVRADCVSHLHLSHL